MIHQVMCYTVTEQCTVAQHSKLHITLRDNDDEYLMVQNMLPK
jgi:hypothetical protein